MIEPKKRWAHAYCLVKKRGLEALGALPAAEIAKTTVNDMTYLGTKYEVIAKLLKEAEKREAK